MRDPLRPFLGQRVLTRRTGGDDILGTLRQVTRTDLVLVDAVVVVGNESHQLDGAQVRSRAGLDVQAAPMQAPQHSTGRAVVTSQGRPRFEGSA